jgi:hypothetical protein
MDASPVQLAYLILPVTIAGICNMIYVKIPLVRRWNAPMDGSRTSKDGKRLFGDHKTWQGFGGMIVLTGLWMAAWVWAATHFSWASRLTVIDYHQWDFPADALWYGGWWGFGYVLFELPNSYIKRRIDIAPGKNASGWKGALFLFIDQADSIVGCMIFMLLFYRPNWREALLIFLMGVGIHYSINILLYLTGLKKQAG